MLSYADNFIDDVLDTVVAHGIDPADFMQHFGLTDSLSAERFRYCVPFFMFLRSEIRHVAYLSQKLQWSSKAHESLGRGHIGRHDEPTIAPW